MNEFVKTECSCGIGYDKGALKKTLENNIFTIFGNLNQNNSIIVRYHGQLMDQKISDSTSFNIFYCFDLPSNDKTEVVLCHCQKCIGECYCHNIDLEHHEKIFFGFSDSNGNYDINSGKLFELSISYDPIENLMHRYGFEKNPNLPTIEKNNSKLSIFKDIINKIKNSFNKIFQ